jgi:hypothetical protein
MPNDTAPFIGLSVFLEPWIKQASLLAESLGAAADCRDNLKPGGQLAKYAEKIIAAVQNEKITEKDKSSVLQEADWMIDTLAGVQCAPENATGLGAARLPEKFWGAPSGRVLITLYKKILGDRMATPIQAGRVLKIDSQTIYRMMYMSRLPSYPDFLSSPSRRTHRVRLDHVQRLLSEEDASKA